MRIIGKMWWGIVIGGLAMVFTYNLGYAIGQEDGFEAGQRNPYHHCEHHPAWDIVAPVAEGM